MVASRPKVEEVPFKIIKEEWNRYELEDGNFIDIKLILTNVVKYPDDVDNFGIPRYVVKSSNVVRANVPLKR